MYVAKIAIDDDPAAPFLDPAVDVERTRTLDFHLPANHIVARIYDSRSGLPIPSASIGVFSEATHEEVGAMTVAHRYTADAKGRLVLPRLRPGKAHVEVSAAGYAPAEPQEIEVDATTERELSFPLEPIQTTRVHVVLPGGAPAANAEAIVVSDPLSGEIVWRGSSDANGDLDIGSRGNSGVLLIRHAGAASRALMVGAIGPTIALAPADPTAVVLRTTDTSGTPVRFALLTVWIDGVRLTNTAAAFATWSDAGMTNGDGAWSGRNLPAAPLRVLATRNVAPAQLGGGAWDALAQVIPYPRAATVDVRVAQ